VDLEDRILAMTQQHQRCGPAALDLPAELRPDRPARARDQHALARQQFPDPGRIGLHRLAAQQIIDLHVAQLVELDAPVQQLVDARHDASSHARGLADVDELAHGPARCARHGDDDLVDMMLSDELWDRLSSSQHPNPVQHHPVFRRVIVDEPNRNQAGLRVLAQFAQHHRACLPCACDQHMLQVAVGVAGLYVALRSARARA